MSLGFLSIAFCLLSTKIWLVNAGKCIVEKPYTGSCYRSSHYTTSCGTFGWRRCNRYRRVSYDCIKSVSEEVCCTGFTGADCSTPVCFNSTVCANSGTCVGPDNCTCIEGYAEPACDDIDECSNGINLCTDVCINTLGTYKCSCSEGYRLQSDLISCSDVNECLEQNGGCSQICVNTDGSYYCGCNEGYELINDNLTCTDKDECSDSIRNCEQGCINTNGSFECYCYGGYNLGYDGISCIDQDECVLGTVVCDHRCLNIPGSYECGCDSGYELHIDKITCYDVDECEINNGGCDHKCTNRPGGYACSCEEGYHLLLEHQCQDIDECENRITCDQTCTNSIGSYICSCQEGYILGIDGKTCENIDDCDDVNCQNGGTCFDKVHSYTCVCPPGFRGDLCEKGKVSHVSVFERLLIPRKLLPEGCFIFDINQMQSLISTFPWTCLHNDQSFCYTKGIVYLEIKTRMHPLSISGVTITDKNLQTIQIGTSTYTQSDYVVEHDASCKATELSVNDIQDFVREGSFIRSYFELLKRSLPRAMRIYEVKPQTLSVHDMKSEIKAGSQIPNTQWCSEAPVMSDRMYNVFRFTTGFSMKIYGDIVYIPEATAGDKFCILADISPNSNGTVFIMIPERVGKTVGQLTEYLQSVNDLRGIGISLDGAINIGTHSLDFWNGYKTFTPSIQNAGLWIGSSLDVSLFIIRFKGIRNYFKSTNNPETVFATVDPYESISTFYVTVAPTFYIRTLGHTYNGSLEGIISTDIDLYQNMQGNSHCDENIVPNGFYTSIKLTINPLKNIPVLRHWSPFQDPTSVLDILIGCQLTEPVRSDFSKYIQDMNQIIADLLTYVNGFVQFSSMSRKLLHFLTTLKSHINQYNQSSFNETVQRNFLQKAWLLYSEVQSQTVQLQDEFEFSVSQTKATFVSFLHEKSRNIQMLLNEMMKTFQIQRTAASKCSSLGLRFKTEIFFEVLEEKIKLGFFNIEFLYSDAILQCSRFHAVSKLLDDEPSIRIIGQASRTKEIGKFLEVVIGGGLEMVMSRDYNKAVIQSNMFIEIFGVHATVDIFFTFGGIFGYYEVNLWNVFYAQIDVTIRYKTSESILLDVSGRFIAKERKKRRTQTNTDFSTTYLNGLKKIINKLAYEASERITVAQMAFTDAQEELLKAQNFFMKQKNIFSNREAFLSETKSKVEKALGIVNSLKAPYQNAVNKLKETQIIVDNLCKIQKCGSLCIPGLKCKMCSKKTWIGRIYYPCCSWYRCMIRFKDPICIIKNIACKVIKLAAFAALEVAKIGVKTAMIPYNAAEIALNAAEFIADKAHWAFKIAANIFDIAKLMLEAAKLFIEMTKKALDAVKTILSTAVKVLSMITEHGLKNIADVSDCKFQVQISDKDLPIFDVNCEINLFKLGWMTYTFTIDFLHPYVSMYNAAKAVVRNGMKGLHLLGRKKRDDFLLHSKMYSYLRHLRDTNNDIVYLNNTLGLQANPPTDYEYRKAMYTQKCKDILHIEEFIQRSFAHLHTITNDSNNIYNIIEEFEQDISTIEIGNITEDLSFESLDVSREYARQDYNLTDDEIDLAEEQSRNEIMNSSILNDFNEIVNRSRNTTGDELNNIDSFNFLSYWFAMMDDASKEYFDPDLCSGFQDCLLHCLSVLFNLFAEEELPNIELIHDLITQLDENITNLFVNRNISIKELLAITEDLNSNIINIINLNPFCAIVPTFRFDLHNITAEAGSNVSFSCDADGDPQPDVWWFKDGKVIAGEEMTYLVISNIGPQHKAAYHCVIGNYIANLSSNEAWLHVVNHKDSDTVDETLGAVKYVLVGVGILFFVFFIGIVIIRKILCREEAGALENDMPNVIQENRPVRFKNRVNIDNLYRIT